MAPDLPQTALEVGWSRGVAWVRGVCVVERNTNMRLEWRLAALEEAGFDTAAMTAANALQ